MPTRYTLDVELKGVVTGEVCVCCGWLPCAACARVCSVCVPCEAPCIRARARVCVWVCFRPHTRSHQSINQSLNQSLKVLESAAKKQDARKEVNTLFEEKLKSGKNRWFFSKLRF